MEKSSVLFSSNTPNTQKAWVKDTLGVKEVERFETYLGLPTLIGRAKYHAFAYLKDKVWKKLQGWKGKILSRARKELLIKAVAQSIPTYTMGVFLLPIKLCDELNSMCARFWWGQAENERKIHWKSWGRLSQSKRKGGMGFRDLRAFNLAMLAKQLWRMVQNPESLIYQCFKYRYFPRCNLLEAGDSTNSSYVWKSLMAAMPILKQGSCWRVGNGASISVMNDKWIMNHPTCKVLHPPEVQEWEWRVSDLIDPYLRCWDRELIWNKFHEEDAEAICRMPLSHRCAADQLIWIYNRYGKYSVKSGYHVATQILKVDEWTECSSGSAGVEVWMKLWKLNVPCKIKIFGWRACQNILPTRVNLAQRKIIENTYCELCKRAPENGIHVLWECGVAQGVWAGSLVKLQKCTHGQGDVLQLFADLLKRLSTEEFELFLVLAWFIWNQRNSVIHGGKLKDPRQVLRRAEDFLAEYHQAQEQLQLVPNVQQQITGWQPPPSTKYKLNFDAAIYTDMGRSGVGAIIRNESGEVMAALSAMGPVVQDSEEAEIVACRKALEFSIDAGFTDLVIEGDNVNVMRAIASNCMDTSRLGTVIEDIHWLVRGLRWCSVSCVKRSANTAAHCLARFARNVSDELVWIEDCPQPAREAVYNDSLTLLE